MNDYETFWREVYVAAIRSGAQADTARVRADDALIAYKGRCKDNSFYN
jgi:hypothetical protein